MLNWASRFNICSFLDNHQYAISPHRAECLVGAGLAEAMATIGTPALDDASFFIENRKDWIFGHLAFDLKNEIEGLKGSKPDLIGFPDIFFYVPQYVASLEADRLQIGSLAADHAEVAGHIMNTPLLREPVREAEIKIRPRLSREAYVGIIERIRLHIRRGDCYEVNFCQEFYSEEAIIDPLSVFMALCRLSPNPFAAWYRMGERYLLCASPERFLRKEGRTILTQPIKGTSRRDNLDPKRDQANREALRNSLKEQSENVMIVDLVRNDLSRICRQGSVGVDELFGIYSFPQVHQMVSTVRGELDSGVSFADIIRATFPMGSMTGAPKRKVLELIESYETSRRGLFSGAVGYITPEGDFDFNVIIRSILYNAPGQYVSFSAGSAITHYSDALKEYEECRLKISAMQEALQYR